MKYKNFITTATIFLAIATVVILNSIQKVPEGEYRPVEIVLDDTPPPRIDTKKGDISITIDFSKLTDEQVVKIFNAFAMMELNTSHIPKGASGLYQINLETAKALDKTSN